MSSFRALGEVIRERRLFCPLYADHSVSGNFIVHFRST